jgi:hypothetical protein
MAGTVKLDQDHLEVVRGTDKDTMVKCSKTSAPDVYITAITPKDTTKLHLDDSIVVAKRTHVRLHLFRTQTGAQFSGEAELTEMAPEPKLSAEAKPLVKARKPKAKTPVKPKSKSKKRPRA